MRLRGWRGVGCGSWEGVRLVLILERTQWLRRQAGGERGSGGRFGRLMRWVVVLVVVSSSFGFNVDRFVLDCEARRLIALCPRLISIAG